MNTQLRRRSSNCCCSLLGAWRDCGCGVSRVGGAEGVTEFGAICCQFLKLCESLRDGWSKFVSIAVLWNGTTSIFRAPSPARAAPANARHTIPARAARQKFELKGL